MLLYAVVIKYYCPICFNDMIW